MTDTFSNLVADPMLQTGTLAVAGAVTTHVILRKHPPWRLAGQLILFTALTILLLYQDIVPFEPAASTASFVQNIVVGLAKIVWWANAAWALIAFIRVFLIFERQPREGRLVQDILIALVYLGALLSVIGYVFAVPVGTLIATSGVLAIIVGLALQSTLSDVFSGIALNIGRPYAIGDWVVLSDGVEGRVAETNWRATHLLNGSNDLVTIPNSTLTKSRLVNLSSPDRSHGVKLDIGIVPTTPPSSIVEVMRNVLMNCNSIMAQPQPGVQVKSMDALSVECELSFRVADISASGKAKTEIFDLIYRHAKASNLILAPLSETSALSRADDERHDQRPMPLRLLDAIPLFALLSERERETLSASMTRKSFRKGDEIVAQGAVVDALSIIRSGVVSLSQIDNGHEIEAARLAPGDCFGEAGTLTGAGETYTVRALTSIVVYEITKAALAPLMLDRPGIAEEIGFILSRRLSWSGPAGRHLPPAQDQSPGSHLVERIRQAFGISHSDR